MRETAAGSFGLRRWLEELAGVVSAWFPPGFGKHFGLFGNDFWGLGRHLGSFLRSWGVFGLIVEVHGGLIFEALGGLGGHFWDPEGAFGVIWGGLWEPLGSFGGSWGSFWRPWGILGAHFGSLGGNF